MRSASSFYSHDDADKCRKYVHGVADPRIEDGRQLKNGTEQIATAQFGVRLQQIVGADRTGFQRYSCDK